MAGSSIHFSVVVPTCARNADLAVCLERLGPGRQAGMNLVPPDSPLPPTGSNYEVIVTDDGRSTTAEAMLRDRFPWARWVRGPCQGPAANRNHGARRARGSWLVFTDDDCLPEPHWLAEFAAGARTATGGEQVLEGRTRAIGDKPHPLAQCPVNETGGCLWSCNFAIARKIFTDLGGFDESFPYAAVEDMEFQIRLRKAGHASKFLPLAVVQHPWKRVRYLLFRRRQVLSQFILRGIHPEQESWISMRMFLRRTGRFYLKELPSNLVSGDWVQLSCLPLMACDQVQTGLLQIAHLCGCLKTRCDVKRRVMQS